MFYLDEQEMRAYIRESLKEMRPSDLFDLFVLCLRFHKIGYTQFRIARIKAARDQLDLDFTATRH
jgi:hypothetical protein